MKCLLFYAQETPGEKFPTDLQLKKKLKAPLLFQAIKPNFDCKIHAL